MKKYFELITIPVAILLLMAYNYAAEWLGMYVFTWEMFGKVFVAFLLFLVSLGFVRLVYMFMFPGLYEYFDSSFQKNRFAWHQLSEGQRFAYASALFLSFFVVFALILNGL